MTIYERKNIRRNIFFIYYYEFPWIFSDKKGKTAIRQQAYCSPEEL